MGAHRALSRSSSFLLPRLAASSALVLALMALLSAAPAAAAGGTYVRLAQLTPDLAGTELVLSSVSDPQRGVTIGGVAYGALSDYRLIQPGDYVVGIQPAGGGGPQLVSTTLNATAGAAYTLAAVGGKTESGLSVFTDDLTPPGAGQGKVRIIDAAPPEPVLDVHGPGGEPFALGVPCGAASDYRTLPAGPTVLTVGRPGGPTVDLPVAVAANQVASVVLVDRGGTIAAEVRVDAQGPVAIPPGPMKAGGGGAAGDRPGTTVGVFTFGALAAGAAALSALLSRRTRGARPHSC